MKIQKILKICALILGGFFIVYAFFFSHAVSPKITAEDAAQAEAFLKFNILTHEGMNLSGVVPHFTGKDKEWSTLLNQQFDRFLAGAPYVSKLPSAPFVFAYSLVFPDGGIEWILWYDDGKSEPLRGPDTTVALPIPADVTVDTILTERMLQAGEIEPLRRGYLVEDGVVKIPITRVPIFIYTSFRPASS